MPGPDKDPTQLSMYPWFWDKDLLCWYLRGPSGVYGILKGGGPSGVGNLGLSNTPWSSPRLPKLS